METNYKSSHKKLNENLILLLILVLASVVRLAGLNSLPDGILPDEAYGAYNAYSLMQEGIDSRGYHYPVYFIAWGSGMSVLYSYLAIPLFRLLGTAIWVYRLPQALVGLCSVPALYVLGKELFSKRFGLFLAFVLAINPWQIMNNRFGLDANMAPGFFLIACCFLVLWLKGHRSCLIPTVLCFGGVLYSYALSWIVLPLFLLISLFLFYKELPSKAQCLLFTLLLFLIALPLMLFVAINLGLLPEINTAFFSIPKLHGFRGSELDFKHISTSASELLSLILHQYDGFAHTSSELVGAYYLFTTPFILFGIVLHSLRLIRGYKKGSNSLQSLFVVWLFAALIMCVLNESITTIHVNLIHIPLIFYSAYGIFEAAALLRNKYILPLCTAFLCFSFGVFVVSYMTTSTTYFFDEKTDEAIETAKAAANGGTITILRYSTIKYSLLLWHEKPAASEYCRDVIYSDDNAWAEIDVWNNYHYINSLDQVTDGLVIILITDADAMQKLGFHITRINTMYALAEK